MWKRLSTSPSTFPAPGSSSPMVITTEAGSLPTTTRVTPFSVHFSLGWRMRNLKSASGCSPLSCSPTSSPPRVERPNWVTLSGGRCSTATTSCAGPKLTDIEEYW